MPTEDLRAYQLHLQSLTDEYHPEGATEAHLVQAISDTAWRLNRVAALETNLLTLAASNQPDPFADAPAQVQDAIAIVAALESQCKALANLSMHSQGLSRQFERTVTRGKTYRLSDDGEINLGLRARNRERLIDEAYDYRQETAAA
jgi:hypothetical protein